MLLSEKIETQKKLFKKATHTSRKHINKLNVKRRKLLVIIKQKKISEKVECIEANKLEHDSLDRDP